MELLQRTAVAYAHIGEAKVAEMLIEQALVWLVERTRRFVKKSDEGPPQE
jgi:hypothetical protein